MKGFNHCIFIGNLGKDPELRHTPSGKAVASVSLAVNESWKNGNGEKVEGVTWVNIVAWSKLAEIISEYAKKGSPVQVVGRLKNRSYDDKESGQKKYTVEIVAESLLLLGKKGEGGGASEVAVEEGDLPF
jgi:single-strand DNA-binding protein